MTTEKALQQVREWAREQIHGADSISLSELTDKAIATFDKPTFIAAFMKEAFRMTMYDVLQRVVYETRAVRLPSATKGNPGDEKPRSVFSWTDHMEHVEGRFLRLWEMTKDDLQKAASERLARARTENSYGLLFQRLAQKLKGKQTVGKRWTEADVNRVWSNIVNLNEAKEA